MTKPNHKKPADNNPGVQSEFEVEEIRGQMRVMVIMLLFSVQTVNRGVKTSSFVSYTVEPDNDDGWTMEQGRVAEALLASRVSKDVYADLGSRNQVDYSQVRQQQQSIEQNYSKLIKNLTSKQQNEKGPQEVSDE